VITASFCAHSACLTLAMASMLGGNLTITGRETRSRYFARAIYPLSGMESKLVYQIDFLLELTGEGSSDFGGLRWDSPSERPMILLENEGSDANHT
jgi:hypothetical protein